MPKGQGDPERIRNLIRNLELVSATQDGQPGNVNPADDPIVQALIGEGEDAVGPLLDCLEFDTRMTRSVRFGRDFFRGRTVVSVSEVAYVALASILNADFFRTGAINDGLTQHEDEGRKAMASQIRAYWNAYGNEPIPQRWYRIVGNEHASEALWLEAMRRIVEPMNVRVRSMGATTFTSVPPADGHPTTEMKGEALRELKDPSVSDLLVRRLKGEEARLRTVQEANAWRDAFQKVLFVGTALAQWDGRGRKAELEEASAQILAGYVKPPPFSVGSAEWLRLEPITTFLEWRLRTGGVPAAKSAVEWLSLITENWKGAPEHGQFGDLCVLAWKHPDAPGMSAAVDALFAKGGGGALFLEKTDWIYDHDAFLTSPMLRFAGVRAEVASILENKAMAGEGEVEAEGVAAYVGGGSFSKSGATPFPVRPAVGTRFPVRYGDLEAWFLSQIPGMPLFILAWPEKRRDEAIAAYEALLRDPGWKFEEYQGKARAVHDLGAHR
ncbi:hypothetical protein SAMN05444156_2702 [Verrucomicrobium sp. GAS474]|nr:hypothetical protein SAMN05444156_2702 [Verrucomicrobium sp. GAS474]